MIKATLTYKKPRTRTKTEEIELPDVVNTGVIINAITEATRNFDYEDCIGGNVFEIALKDGRTYRCYQFANINQYRLFIEKEPDAECYEWLADFKC